jgi:hypothetical protein
MKLTDLDPQWVGAGGDGISDRDGRPVPARHGVGLSLNCPCGCDSRFYVGFTNPLDGGPPHSSAGQPTWSRTGETFDELELTPSIQRRNPCRWHGYLTHGELVSV